MNCDGYKIYEGQMTVTPRANRPSYHLRGTFLYRPDTQTWYCKGDPHFPGGTSVPAYLCSEFIEKT